MSKCILLGAGASFGYSESLSDLQIPPLTDEIFSKGFKLGLLDNSLYVNLIEKLGHYSREILKNGTMNYEYRIDVEQFMSWLAEQLAGLDKRLNEVGLAEHELRSSLFKQTKSYQRAIGEVWYLVFDVIRHFSVSYKPSFDAYRRLALHSYDCFYNVVTLNYDTIFEAAILHSGIGYNYGPPNSAGAIPIAKLHGSVNWLNPIGRGIANQGLSKPDEIFRFASGLLYTNRINMDAPRILDLMALSKLRLKDLFRSGTDYEEPILIPPIGGHKDYEKVKLYQEIWNFASRMVGDASELVVVGTKLREQDTRLAELLKTNLKQSADIVAVGNKDRIVQGLENMLGRKPKEPISHFPHFMDYARSL